MSGGVTNPIPDTAPRSPLGIADYRRFWLARCASFMAGSGMVVILGYQLYDLARRSYGLTIPQASFALGLLGLAQFVPMFLLTPVSGVVADRFDRRHVAGIAQGVDVIIAITLALTTAAQLVTLPLLFALAAGHGVARVFTSPAMGSIAPRLVPAELLPRAIALNSMAMQTGVIAGPAFAGLLYARGPALPYAVASVLLAGGALSVLSLRALPPLASSRHTHPLRQVADGLAFVRSNHFLLGCMTLDLFAVLLGGATALLPVYARDILHVGSEGLGQMRAAPALGAAATGLWLSLRPLTRNVGVKMLWCVALFGAATVVFGISRNYALTLVALVVLGAADMISMFVRGTLVQLHTPDDKRGRVSAISGLAISASNELGEMESGLAAALLGATGAVVFGGVAAIVVTGIWAWAFPEIRRARSFTPHNQ
jgi:MFS family permease